MVERLFVYGTLAPGRANAHVLAGIPGAWQRASIRGRLVHSGWGAEQGYPAVIVDAAGEAVDGFLLTSAALAGEWERLDAFEGAEYERVTVQAHLEDGQVEPAFVYQLRQ